MKKLVFYLSLLTCLYLTPIQSRIWNGPETPATISSLARIISPEQLPLMAVAKMPLPLPVYFTYGHFFVIIYIGLLLLLTTDLVIKSWLKYSLVMILVMGLLANIYNYWISEFFPGYRHDVFLFVELPTVTLALLGFTIVLFQYATANKNTWLKWSALGLVPLAGILIGTIRYMPHAPMLAILVSLIPFIHPQKNDHETQ